jgi:hypothetical protein
VVITATDAETGGAGLAAPTTEYKAPGSASFVAGLPGSLSLGLPLTGPSATSWSISGTLNAPALGIYEIRVKVKDACGAEGSTTFKIDVRTSCVGSLGDKPMYVGQTYVVADVNGSAKIALSAGLKACEPGADIRLAKVTFAIRNADGTCTPLPGAANLPVGLVDPGNLQCGTATTIVTYNLGKNVASACIQIAILVGGNFVHNIPADDELVTIAMPVQKSSILGCGKIPNCDTNGVNTTRGVLKGVDGDNTKVFFNLTYTKSGSNPQGKVTLLVHSKKNPDGISPDFAEPHCYKITSTAIASLTVNGTNSAATGKALFTSKCTVQDITNPNSLPISLDGSATLQVTATDGTPNLTPPYPGKDDYVSVYVIGKSGGVWFANKLNAKLQAVETPVIANSGDVVVK